MLKEFHNTKIKKAPNFMVRENVNPVQHFCNWCQNDSDLYYIYTTYIFDQFELSFAHEMYTIKIMKVGKENVNKGLFIWGKKCFWVLCVFKDKFQWIIEFIISTDEMAS